jgi:hypothetical protein
MYVNAKMIPAKTIPGMEEGEERRMVEGLNSRV